MGSLNADIGNLIRERRELRGLTQAQLGRLSGVPRTTLANIEHGRQAVLVKYVYLFADALGLNPCDLLPVPTASVMIEHSIEAPEVDALLAHLQPYENGV